MKSLNCVCVLCVYNIISLLVQGNDIIPHTHTTQRTDIALSGSIFTVHPLLQNHSVTKPYHLSLPSPPFPSSLSLSLPLPPLPLSLLLYVSMAERDQGQLRLVLSVQGILWKQYITGNSCQSTSPSICVSSPSSLHPSC